MRCAGSCWPATPVFTRRTMNGRHTRWGCNGSRSQIVPIVTTVYGLLQLLITLSRWSDPLPEMCSYVVPSRTRVSLWIFERTGRSQIMRSDIVAGGIFPDYELHDHTDKQRKLSELQGDDPLILTLARGHYCPKEHQQHLELAAFYPKIAVAYTQIATIATDEHHTLQEFRASVGAQWTFLSDPDRT